MYKLRVYELLEILRYVAMFTLYSYWLSIIGYVLLSNNLDEFQPLFLKVKQSLYSERYTFMTGLMQDTVLGFHIDNPDIMHDVQSDDWWCGIEEASPW